MGDDINSDKKKTHRKKHAGNLKSALSTRKQYNLK